MRKRAMTRRVALALGIAHCAFAVAAPLSAAEPAAFDVVLSRMFDYVERFQREFGSMVAEERYEQTVRQAPGFSRGETRRVLRSDFLLVNIPGQGWLPFRDVFEADSRQIRDREDRLTALFLSGPTSDAIEHARRIMNESARYNIGDGTRNINVPTLALMYLGSDARSGMRFSEGKSDRPDQRVIEFLEVRRPALISTTGGRDLAARGILWVDEDTGTITRTELHADDTSLEAQVTVSFERETAVNAWVPKRMEDRFKRRGSTSEVRGVATYSRFRRFQVSTSEDIATPDGGGKP
jgi:hypothetical protein